MRKNKKYNKIKIHKNCDQITKAATELNFASDSGYTSRKVQKSLSIQYVRKSYSRSKFSVLWIFLENGKFYKT